MIFDFVLAQREIIRTARKNTVGERKKQAGHHQAQGSGQGGRLQPTAVAEEESSGFSSCARLPAEERIGWIRQDRWINYTRAEQNPYLPGRTAGLPTARPVPA